MMRLLFPFIIVVFLVSWCCAQEVSVPSGADKSGNLTQLLNDTSSDDATITFTGRVNYISSAYIMSGASRQINIIDDNGLETIFIIANDTAITGKDGKKSSLNWISRKDRVSLEYITNIYGNKMVKSIKVLSGW